METSLTEILLKYLDLKNLGYTLEEIKKELLLEEKEILLLIKPLLVE